MHMTGRLEWIQKVVLHSSFLGFGWTFFSLLTKEVCENTPGYKLQYLDYASILSSHHNVRSSTTNQCAKLIYLMLWYLALNHVVKLPVFRFVLKTAPNSKYTNQASDIKLKKYSIISWMILVQPRFNPSQQFLCIKKTERDSRSVATICWSHFF